MPAFENGEKEKVYIVCTACGESFDNIEIAHNHERTVVATEDELHFEDTDWEFTFWLRPESEAM